jgi:hypothetical protein
MRHAKRMNRRTMLRGAGAAIALPWLEQMTPVAQAAKLAQPQRALFIYTPNGVILDSWIPKQAGATFELPPTLSPLQAHRKEVSVVSHLDRTYVSGTGVHAQCGSCWLTSSPPTEALDGGFPTNISLDQMLAQHMGAETAFASLELSTNNHTDNKETRYFESISWFGPGYAANVEKDPRAVFDRLFGQSKKDPARASILDVVLDASERLRETLGKEDRSKLDEYLGSIRSVERRIEIAEAATKRRSPRAFAQPPGMPEDRGAYIRLMIDLIILAFEQDLTRVATLVIDPERWDTPRTYHGVLDKPEDHHQLTHTKGEEAIHKLRAIDRFHVSQFAYLIGKLKESKEGDATLLDNSVAVMGSGLGDGSVHSYKELPVLMTGGGGRETSHGAALEFF